MSLGSIGEKAKRKRGGGGIKSRQRVQVDTRANSACTYALSTTASICVRVN